MRRQGQGKDKEDGETGSADKQPDKHQADRAVRLPDARLAAAQPTNKQTTCCPTH